jgi:hypothetical protein
MGALKVIKKIRTGDLSDKWFYSRPNFFLRQLHVYVKGDALVIIPIWIFIIITAIFSWKFMLLEVGVFMSLRGFGEMIYWLLQQFGEKKYRPSTQQKKLGNDAVYILYQLSGFRNAFIGIVLTLYVLIYLF